MTSAPVKVSSKLRLADHLGAWAVRWSIGRMKYRVEPGIYQIGTVDQESPVLVTANYKLSFDHVRSAVQGFAAYILVLDTKGVNVWCAAGKGSFGTDELLRSITVTGLANLVRHREIIVPQLGAVGVSAPLVKAMSGFKVLYGPVLARDLGAYLAAGKKKTPAMGEMPFRFVDRLVLTPMELVQSARFVPLLLVLALLLGLPLDAGFRERTLSWTIVILAVWPLGSVLFPLLLPYLPWKAFGLKGLFLGTLYASMVLPILALRLVTQYQSAFVFALSGLAALGAILPFFVYTAMNFTGASTFTSQTGAGQEVKTAVPLIKMTLVFAALAMLAKIILGGIQ